MPRPLPPAVQVEFGHDVEAEQAWLRLVRDPDEAVAVAVLLAHAENVQASDPSSSRSSEPHALGQPSFAEHATVAVVGTADDDPASWLRAGQAFARLLLRATGMGVAASPPTQVLDVPHTRRRLAAALGVVGFPQLVLRLGYARAGPRPPRRTVETPGPR